MPNTQSKMQIRAEVISLLAKYKEIKNVTNENIANDISTLSQIENQEYVAKILFKEISSSNNQEIINISSIILLQITDKDIFENCAIKTLQDKNVSDEKKFLIISLIKQKGLDFDYENIEDYITNPQEIAQSGVEDFLQNAKNDPEVQIDLLDFFLNIPYEERICILENLAQEKSDSSIHAMSLLAQLHLKNEELEPIIESMLNTDSPYSIEGIEYILKNYKIDLKIRQKLHYKLQKIKEKNPNFNNNEIIENTIIYDSLISFIDGNSNFSLIISRQDKNDNLNVALYTIDTKCGIAACMGFGGINKQNYLIIKKRLFSDSLPVKINPMALKGIFQYYKSKNKKTNSEIPYELIVWEKLMSDIEDINYDISQYITSKLNSLNLTSEKVNQILTSKIVESWYWPYGQNKKIDNLIDTIEKEHICDFKIMDKIIENCIDEEIMTDESIIDDINDKLIISAYVAHLANLKMSSAILYSLCFKNPYYKLFLSFLIYKSIYSYFAEIYQDTVRSNSSTIFKKAKNTGFSIEEINTLLLYIEEKWT